MKTKAIRLHGERDLRLDDVELPPIKDDEILAEIVSDSICMSSYKAATQGANHKRIPNNVDQNPIMVGHEFCGRILEVGSTWSDQFTAGQKFSIQPALNDPAGPVGILSAPGYSYPHIGGDAQHVIIPAEVMQNNCLLPFEGDAYYLGSLAEPLSCVIGAFRANYHTTPGSYQHQMGIVEGGSLAILGGVGPMGLGAIDYIIHCDRRPRHLVITGRNQQKLDRAAALYPPAEAAKQGIELHYINSNDTSTEQIKTLSADGKGFDDLFVYAPTQQLVEQADQLLGFDGCLNFFAGPSDPNFSVPFNFFNVHYAATHVVGTSGGNTDDMIESLQLMADGKVDPSGLVTHIGGLNAVINTTLQLPDIPGGKKLIYTHLNLPLIALDQLDQQPEAYFAELAKIVKANNGLWSPAAETILLANAPKL
ncbi:MAG: L-sorbose 1-phosphate reductase [Kiritimatiellaceae bacterium TMED266]|jgi:threonine dehydrogenase-like Zn-dependent dehydrogenase|nr:MAG: L-sorbose 1-phosphate reductase [Kiritimatiellaceae bacterium TMED266]